MVLLEPRHHDAHGAEVILHLPVGIDDHAQVADIAIGDGIVAATIDVNARAYSRHGAVLYNITANLCIYTHHNPRSPYRYDPNL